MSCVQAADRNQVSATLSCQDEHRADDSRHAVPITVNRIISAPWQRFVSECPDLDRSGKHNAGDAENPVPDLFHARREQLTHRDTACQQGQRNASPRQEGPLVGERKSVIGFLVDPRRIPYVGL